MPDQTPILSLPLILPSQAQKHVTHNEALRLLDVLVQLSVRDRDRTTPPATPVIGARHLVAPGAGGDWAGQEGHVALWEGSAWAFFAPLTGWQAFVEAEQAEARFDGTTWVAPTDGPLQVSQLGVSASPDATNRFAVASPATLLNHAGAGHQLKINKAAATDTASLLFQTGFSGRAEMGLAGGDDFAIKVSADGATYFAALSAAAGSGQVTLAHPLTLAGQSSDPASPADGVLWHDATQGRIKVRLAGVTRMLDRPASAPCLVPPVGEYVQTSTGAGGAALGALAGVAGRMELFPFVARADLVFDQIAVNCTTAVAGASGKVVLYAADADGRPADLIAETADMDFAATGIKTAALLRTLRQGDAVWFGIRHSANAALTAWSAGSTPDINGGAPTTAARKVLRRTLAYATGAPATWGYLSSEITNSIATAIWLRMA